MRTLLVIPALASVLSSVRPADACGGYIREPQLMRISSHHTEGTTRSFVLLGDLDAATAKQAKWVRLAPSTYDYAALADATDLDAPMTFTLIGPSGTRVVSTRQRSLLSQTFVSYKPSIAMEIRAPKGRFSIAMVGNHERAAWLEPGREQRGAAADVAWVKTLGIELLGSEYVYVSKLKGTRFETVTVLPKGGGIVTLVRSNGSLYAKFDGSVAGGIEMDGRRFIVASKHGEGVRAIAL